MGNIKENQYFQELKGGIGRSSLGFFVLFCFEKYFFKKIFVLTVTDKKKEGKFIIQFPG